MLRADQALHLVRLPALAQARKLVQERARFRRKASSVLKQWKTQMQIHQVQARQALRAKVSLLRKI